MRTTGNSPYPLILLLAYFIMAGCLREDELTREFTGFTPLEINDGWELSSPGAENMDSLELARIYKDLFNHDQAWTVKSLLVFRNGKLVAEGYLKDDNDRMRYNAIWSCTKQVTSIITGMVIEAGYINSVHDSIEIYLREELAGHPDKKLITIDQLLTMRSGIYFDNDAETDVFRRHMTTRSVEYVLGRDLTWDPGTHFQYNDGAPQLLSAVIQNATGMTLAEYAEINLFSEIGLTNYEWKAYSDGITIGAFGLLMPPRELAKIAQTVCDSGKWHNQQLIPKHWLTQMLTSHVTDILEDDQISFGYYWWLNKSKGFVYMWGHGGQYAIIYPETKLVIVITAPEQLSGDFTFPVQEIFNIADRINLSTD